VTLYTYLSPIRGNFYASINNLYQVFTESSHLRHKSRLLTLCLFSGFLFIQFPIDQLAFMTTVLSFYPPKSPLKRGTLRNFPVPPFLRGARGDLTRLLHEKMLENSQSEQPSTSSVYSSFFFSAGLSLLG